MVRANNYLAALYTHSIKYERLNLLGVAKTICIFRWISCKTTDY